MNSSRNNHFPKDLKLCSKTEITELFQNGSVFFVYPFRIVFKNTNKQENQYLISASKRKFKHAVDRNRIKRLCREAIRLHFKHAEPQTFQIVFQYTAKTILPFDTIENSIHAIQKQLHQKYSNSNRSISDNNSI